MNGKVSPDSNSGFTLMESTMAGCISAPEGRFETCWGEQWGRWPKDGDFYHGDRLTLKENTKHKNCFKIQYKFREAITIVKRMLN